MIRLYSWDTHDHIRNIHEASETYRKYQKMLTPHQNKTHLTWPKPIQPGQYNSVLSVILHFGFVVLICFVSFVPGSKVAILGMVIPPLIGNPYNGYINPYYWVDDHPLLYGNNGSLDPSTRVRRVAPWKLVFAIIVAFKVQGSKGFIKSTTSHVISCHALSCHFMSIFCHFMSFHVNFLSFHVNFLSFHVISCQFFCHFMSFHVNFLSFHVISCQFVVISCHFMSIFCHFMSIFCHFMSIFCHFMSFHVNCLSFHVISCQFFVISCQFFVISCHFMSCHSSISFEASYPIKNLPGQRCPTVVLSNQKQNYMRQNRKTPQQSYIPPQKLPSQKD